MSQIIESWYKKIDNTIILSLYIQPNARKNEVVGLHGNSLKIKLATLPIDGRANKALLEYLAELLNVRLSQVTLKQGEKSRHKIIEIKASQIDWSSFKRKMVKQ